MLFQALGKNRRNSQERRQRRARFSPFQNKGARGVRHRKGVLLFQYARNTPKSTYPRILTSTEQASDVVRPTFISGT